MGSNASKSCYMTWTTLGTYLDRTGGSIQTGPFGSQLHASDYVEKGIPSVMPKNITVEGVLEEDIARITEDDAIRLSKYRLDEGDIIYSRRGDVEKCSLIKLTEKGWLCGTGCLRIRLGGGELTPEFLHAYLSSPVTCEWISRHAVGATMPNLNTGILRDVPLVIPSQESVKLVSDLWGELNSKITLNNQINQTLEQMAQTLFKSWFVDFDPVIDNALDAGSYIPEIFEARVERRKAVRESADFKPLPDDVRQLFPSEFEESELGWVPKGWSISRLDNILELAYGKALKKTDRIVGEFPVYGSGGVNGSHNTALVEGPGIIVGRKGTVGSLYWESRNFFPIDTVFYVKPKPQFSLNYCYQLLQTLGLDTMNTDAAVPGLNRNNAYRLECIVPSTEVLERATLLLNGFQDRIELNLSENNSLEKLRDTLLPKLISGELRLDSPEVEQAKALVD